MASTPYRIIIIITILSKSIQVFSIYQIQNISINKYYEKPAIWTEMGVFGPLLEEWALMTDKHGHREQRVMQLPPTQGGFVASNATNNEPMNGTRSLGKIVVSRPPNNRPMSQSGGREVSETDLYLLGAIEKLVYRVDFMEKRLRRVEEMLFYAMAGNKIDRDPCPDNFSRAGENCYHFGEKTFDWKEASKICRRLSATLLEIETIHEKQTLASYIQTNSHLRGKDYWTGGLNPGLLWIWSGTGRPVINKSGENASDIRGKGRCLGMIYDPSIRNYVYRGQDCSIPQYYICEIEDRSSSNEINRISKHLKEKNEL